MGEDLGWYRGDNFHQNYTYLKDDGCKTIRNMSCHGDDDEFCSAAEQGHDHCYTNKLGKAHCGRSQFTGSCSYISPTPGALCTVNSPDSRKNFNFESFGPHSRCVMAERSRGNFDAACLRMR